MTSDPRVVARGLEASFRDRFGAGAPPRLFLAPGRVNLMGAHLDHNGGPVVPMAIDRHTHFALRPRADDRARLASTREAGEVEVRLGELPEAPEGAWWDYPLGVVRGLALAGAPLGGFDLLVGGDLPIGAGLSSSASITVGTAFALDRVFGLGRGLRAAIDTALYAERDFVGVPCGIMDPFAVALSREDHLLWVDCKDESVAHLPLPADRFAIAVADSGLRRELARGAFKERVDECREAFRLLAPHQPGAVCLRDVPRDVFEAHERELPPKIALRARHVVEEVQRTFEARKALEAGDVAGFGRRITEAHESLARNFEVSVPELDVLVEAAVSTRGVLGSRLTGAGFGGCVVILCERSATGALTEAVERAFERRFGRRPPLELFGGDRGPREFDTT
ncbi:MAG: galactokinase [Planctomycetota bacterium]